MQTHVEGDTMSISHRCRSIIQSFALAAVIVSGVAFFSMPAAAQDVLTLLSRHDLPYHQVAAGFERGLKASGMKVSVVAAPAEVHELESRKSAPPSLVFAVGARAVELAKEHFPNVPMVAGLVVDASAARGHRNATAVTLETPLVEQLEEIKRLLPGARVIGVVYSSGGEGARLASAERAAHRLGLSIEARKISSTAELPLALSSLEKSANVLWGLPDPVVLSSLTAKHLLVFSVRNQIPFVGPSSSWAKAGALFAFDWDFVDIGVQCGEIGARVLGGASAASIAPAVPRRLRYAVNAKTAQQLKRELPPQVLKGAFRVY